MELRDLLHFLNLSPAAELKLDQYITNLTLNSKKVTKNSVFVALKGTKSNGNDYIDAAFSQGAICVLSDNINAIERNIFYIANLKEKMAKIAQFFYPNLPHNIIAVTGTNGKTSVVDFIRQLLWLLKSQVATIGTMGIYRNDKLLEPVINTTPDIFSLHQAFSDFAKENCDNVVFEASSHAIDQARIAGLAINIAAFTNLTQDHLDYHQNMENYFAAKAKLFSSYLISNGIAVINSDSDYAKKLKAICNLRRIKTITYGRRDADLLLHSYENNKITLNYNNISYEAVFNLSGDFQIDNILCAVAILLALNIDMKDIISVTANLVAVKGRIEEVQLAENFRVFVDYAHTPAALENILLSLKPYVAEQGRLIVVFGCGGERDMAKRAIMGEIADKYSDYIIITDDNPRNEDASSIRTEILSAINNKTVQEIPDRTTAIKTALDIAQEGDIILIAGKGHENYQIIADQKLYFDDVEIVKEYRKQGKEI